MLVQVREHWTFIYSPSDTPETASDGVIFYLFKNRGSMKPTFRTSGV